MQFQHPSTATERPPCTPVMPVHDEVRIVHFIRDGPLVDNSDSLVLPDLQIVQSPENTNMFLSSYKIGFHLGEADDWLG